MDAEADNETSLAVEDFLQADQSANLLVPPGANSAPFPTMDEELPGMGRFDWPSPILRWTSSLPSIQVLDQSSDLVRVTAQVVEVDGGLVQQPWSAPLGGIELTQVTADGWVILTSGGITSKVRLDVWKPLPPRLRTIAVANAPVQYPFPVFLPRDAFVDKLPLLGDFPEEVGFDLADAGTVTGWLSANAALEATELSLVRR